MAGCRTQSVLIPDAPLYNRGMSKNVEFQRSSSETINYEAAKFLRDTQRTVGMMHVPSEIDAAVDILLHTNGKIITTGMGKAGHIAQKCASSLCSLSFPAVYLHPGDAAHGDIGIIKSYNAGCPELGSKADTLIAFSTSGKTREVLETIKFSRALGIWKVITITSHSVSPVKRVSDVVLDMGRIGEAGHLGLAPTTSAVIMMIVADMLALVAAKMKDVTKEDYGARHHGGYLGRKCRGETR